MGRKFKIRQTENTYESHGIEFEYSIELSYKEDRNEIRSVFDIINTKPDIDVIMYMSSSYKFSLEAGVVEKLKNRELYKSLFSSEIEDLNVDELLERNIGKFENLLDKAGEKISSENIDNISQVKINVNDSFSNNGTITVELIDNEEVEEKNFEYREFEYRIRITIYHNKDENKIVVNYYNQPDEIELGNQTYIEPGIQKDIDNLFEKANEKSKKKIDSAWKKFGGIS